MQNDFCLPHFNEFRFSFQEVCPDDKSLSVALQMPDMKVFDEMRPIIDGILQRLESNPGIVGGYSLHNCSEVNLSDGYIRCGDYIIQSGKRVAAYMKGSEKIAAFVCTAGSAFTELADEYLGCGDIAEAFIVDSIGSVTVENAMDKIQKYLEEDMSAQGYISTNRYSPGYCEWHVSGQPSLFSMMGKNSTGVSLTESCLMQPIKSVSGIIGIGKSVRKRSYGCDICNSPTCVYRSIKRKT